uniref:SCP domain-containing protein n=1 Tax=Strongyloides papillosus TaxID=174720 RepID=A0A0N5BXE3_STREA
MKKFFTKRLKKSKSLHESNEVQENTNNKKGSTITASKTFTHVPNTTRSCAHGNGLSFDVCGSLVDVHSTTSSVNETRSAQSQEMDKHMMQMISDVKYMKRRPKFMEVSEVNFQRQCLDAHNQLRTNFGCPPLSWSQELADVARAWAMKLAERGRVLYPELIGIGENIYLDTGVSEDHLTTGSEIVTHWAKEAEYFNFDNPRWHPKCQKFTQMIWRDSEELGIYRYWNTSTNCLCIVAFYKPGGNCNTPGSFASNVPTKAALNETLFETGSPIRSIIASIKKTSRSNDNCITVNESPYKSINYHPSPLAKQG